MDQRIIDKFNLISVGYRDDHDFVNGIKTYKIQSTDIYMKEVFDGKVEVTHVCKVDNVKKADRSVWSSEGLIDLDFEVIISEIKRNESEKNEQKN